jgi:hypothetical protein
MASSTLGLTLNWAPFPLVKEVLMEESMFVEISTKVQVGGQGNNIQWEKRTAKIRKINHLNKELMMNSIIEFQDACAAGCLNLSNGEKIYSRFVFRVHLVLPFSNTDLIDQKNMLAEAKKPFKYMVKVLCSRIRHLNKLMSKLPGANNMLPYDKGALKIKLFKMMMLSDWQINFNNAGLNITDDAYTLQRLVRFMTVQEATFNAIQERKRSTTTLQAHRSPAHPGGGRVAFQQGRHGCQGGLFWWPGFTGARSGARGRQWCRG